MQSTVLNKDEKLIFSNPLNRLLLSGVAVLSGTLSLLVASKNPSAISLLKDTLLASISGLASNLIASKIEDKFIDKFNDDSILQNDDLVNAVGKATLLIILDESQNPEYGVERQILKYLGKTDIQEWSKIVNKNDFLDKDFNSLTSKELDEISPTNLSKYFTPAPVSFNNIKFLSIESWEKIIKLLIENTGFFLRQQSITKLAQNLNENFVVILRKILIDDLTHNSKAYSSIQLRLMGEILFQINEENLKATETLETIKNIQTNIENINSSILDISEVFPKFIPKRTFPKRLSNFIGRQKELENLKFHLNREGKTALVGLHGMGKSSLSIQYAYLNSVNYKFIIYIRANSNEILSELAKCADEIGIISFADTTFEEKALTLKKWLEDQENYLLIFDDINDASQIKPFVPINDKADIIFISNNKSVSYLANPHKIETIPSQEAELFLYQTATNNQHLSYNDIPEQEREIIRQLVAELHGIPLVLNLVGAYLSKNQISFTEYLKNLKINSAKRDFGSILYSSEHSGSIFSAFSIAFDKIAIPENDSFEAKTISDISVLFLKIASFLAPNNIPLEIFTDSIYGFFEEKSLLIKDKFPLETIVKNIEQFSLFEQNKDDNTLGIHPLAQQFIFSKIESNEKFVIGSTLLVALQNLLPYFDYTNKEICERYYPHVIKVLGIANKIDLKTSDSIALYSKIGRYYEFFGNFQNAQEFYTQSNLISKEIFGENHPDTATSYSNLGAVFYSQGDYLKAEEYLQKASQIQLNIFGENHPSTATSLDNLGNIYQARGEYAKAEEYIQKALRIKLNVFEGSHPDIATSYNNLGLIYYFQQDFDKAEEFHQKALQIDLDIFGENHPATAKSYNNMGVIYRSKGDYKKAEAFHQKVLTIRLNILGENHPDTARSYGNLANVYNELGDFSMAENAHLKALQIELKVLGENHPDTAKTYSNLGLVYLNQTKFSEAKIYFEKALKIYAKFLPENHPYIQQAKNNLERVRGKLGK